MGVGIWSCLLLFMVSVYCNLESIVWFALVSHVCLRALCDGDVHDGFAKVCYMYDMR